MKKFLDFFVDTGKKEEIIPQREDYKPPERPFYVEPATVSVDTERFKQQFAHVLAQNRKTTNDYLGFRDMVQAMVEIPQEDVRYRSAFVAWKAGNFGLKTGLLDSANGYVKMVEKEMSDFELAYKQEYQTQVGATEEVVKQKKARAQELTRELAQLESDLLNLAQQQINATKNLEQKRNGFIAAGEQQRKELQVDIDKINQYIS